MNQPLSRKANLYDILGVLPDASDEEIRKVSDWLIHREGFRVGVPLRGQWARAREIKAAYAILGDADKRRAYDESLAESGERPLWPAPASDAGSDRLVRPAESERVNEDRGVVAADAVSGAAIAAGAEAPEPAGPPPEEAGSVPYEAGEPFAYGAARHMTVEDDRRFPAKVWAPSAAVIVGLGLVLVASWPGGEADRTVVDSPREARSARGLPAFAGTEGEQFAALPASAPEGGPSNGADLAGAAADPGLPQDSLGDAPQAGIAAAGDPADPAGPRQSSATQAEAPAAPAEPVEAAAASAQPAPAPARPAPAPAPAAPVVEANISRSALPQAIPISRPARWIGGGPNDKDNRGGKMRGSVSVRFTVRPGGQVSNCAPTRGSGNARLDALTCRLIEERARFTPAVDAQGRSVASQIDATYVWGRGRRPK